MDDGRLQDLMEPEAGFCQRCGAELLGAVMPDGTFQTTCTNPHCAAYDAQRVQAVRGAHRPDGQAAVVEDE